MRQVGPRKIARRAICAALCISLPAACAHVPSSGPSRLAVTVAAEGPHSAYLLVPINDSTLLHLLRDPGPSLRGGFDDHRAAVEQRIGIGDTVEVAIFEAAAGGLFSTPVSSAATTGAHSALIPPQVVQRDGSITVPYAGRVAVAAKTTPEVERIIVARLTGKAIEPQAIVTLSRTVATSVTVGGEVVRGARIPLSARGDRLLDVIAEAGGILAPANESFLALTRGGRTVRVPFQTLLTHPKENIFARPEDVLTVERYPLTFTAVGATSRNAVIPFDAVGISLEEAIGKAAGVIDERADPEGVFVFRYEPIAVARAYPSLTPAQAGLDVVPTVYAISMRDPKSLFLARRFPIRDKDIVYVSNSPFSDMQKVFELVGAVAGPVIQGVAVASYLK